jgi:hypothetical protein
MVSPQAPTAMKGRRIKKQVTKSSGNKGNVNENFESATEVRLVGLLWLEVTLVSPSQIGPARPTVLGPPAPI